MAFHLPRVIVFLAVTLVVSHAAFPPELYWKSVLPNTPMPKAVTDLLQPDFVEDKSTAVGVGNGGVNVQAGQGKPGGTSVNVGNGGVNVNTGKGKPVGGGGGTHVNVGTGTGTGVGVGVGVNTPNPGKGTNVGVGKGGVSVSAGHKGTPVYVGVKPGYSPFLYKYAATENQLHDNPNVALFFLEKDMYPGTEMNLHFVKSSNAATFLPRQATKSIPFSSNKLPEIFNQFSVVPGSLQAEIVTETIKECESPSTKGEEKYCATSLESMVDFSTSKLGKDVNAISTEVDKETPPQKYTIVPVVKKMEDDKSVVCHKQNYAYAVFYCHTTQNTETYMVPLKGADGTKAKAVAVCHKDTSTWNPKHVAFQALNVKPGTVPVCHFLPEDHIVWVKNKKST